MLWTLAFSDMKNLQNKSGFFGLGIYYINEKVGLTTFGLGPDSPLDLKVFLCVGFG
jgi:hypothetical protein